MNRIACLFLIYLFISIISGCIGDSHKKVIVLDPDGYFREEYIVINDSIKDGIYLKYFDNGNLSDSCFYQNDTLQGERKLYTHSGNLEILETYKDGKLNGPYKVFYPSGTLKLLQYFRNDVLLDTSYAYFESGKLKEKVVFENGEENGPFVEFYENGQMHWRGNYLNGDNEQDSLYEYSESGELIKIMYCQRGICYTVWTKDKGKIKKYKNKSIEKLVELSEKYDSE